MSPEVPGCGFFIFVLIVGLVVGGCVATGIGLCTKHFGHPSIQWDQPKVEETKL